MKRGYLNIMYLKNKCIFELGSIHGLIILPLYLPQITGVPDVIRTLHHGSRL